MSVAQRMMMTQGGGTPFSPYDIAGLVLDMNADVGVTGSPVDSWANQGSAGGSFVGALTARPTVDATGVNGRTAIVFDGVNDKLSSALKWADLFADPSSWTAFALMRYVGGSATQAVAYDDAALLTDAVPSGSRSIGIMGSTQPMVGMYHYGGSAQSAQDTTHFAAGVDAVITGYYDSAGPTLSVQVGSNTPVANTVNAPGAIGATTLLMGTNYASAQFAGFKLRRLLVYSSKLTAPQIAQVQSYMGAF
jgi:hypothetical protein